MKKTLVFLGFALVGFAIYWFVQMYAFAKGVQADTPNFVKSILDNRLQNGDIIFHTSNSNQSKAIQIATNSQYSHMGIIFQVENDWFVFEAIQPVKMTPLSEWTKRGKNGRYVVKRLKNSDKVLTPKILKTMRQIGRKHLGKDYDLLFEWSDEKIYCSELVWKIYKDGAGIEIGELGQYSDFDLSHPTVKSKVSERYGANLPLNEKVISPASIFNSNKLEVVYEN